MFELTDALTASAGLHRYETSNHAVEGEESQHNLLYWRYGDYVGIGPGAHGRLTIDGKKWATEAERMPGAWLAGVQGVPQTAHSSQELSAEDMAAEMLLMGLRISDGVSLARVLAIDPDVIDADAMAGLEVERLIERKDGHLRLTKKGQPLLNSILRDLIA
jgi:oxygen-independent coproporphyrinogen-3 oxidase